jgi:phosphate transport system permease protein
MRRYLFDKTFKIIAITSIVFSLALMLCMFFSLLVHGCGAFFIHETKVSLTLNEQYTPQAFLSPAAEFIVKDFLVQHPEKKNQNVSLWLPLNYTTTIKDQLATKVVFNKYLFSNTDSKFVEYAGMKASIMGSLLVILVAMLIAIPLSLASAIYLEKYAPQNMLTYWLEININNLSAMPSIVFGLIGLLLFIGVFNLPRASAIVGGMTLSLMVMPSIIIATREAIKNVPIAIEDAARALGARELQILMHHILPIALPNIMTGIIFAIARAIGETAPLMLIGMVAFVLEAPGDIFDPTTTMPVQIYLWANNPEAGFLEKTSAAILILLAILLLINILSFVIRRKFETKW